MEKFKFDVVAQTLTITAQFAEAMNNPGSEEYKLYQKFSTDFPNLKVIGKTHRTPTTYVTKSNEKFHHNPYKGITVENMERFIAVVDDKEQSYKKEYNRVCAYAQAMGKKKAYAIVAGWFVEQFPKYRTEPFYYFNNHPTLIPFQPSNNKENSEPELAATGTEG